ncbi:MAG: hypothetical protein K2K39_02765 [Clostridia bacterium]|nr:hypothetical protein [Clostridia bacterium]
MKKVLCAAVAAVALSAAVAFAWCAVSTYSTFKKATGVAVPECGGVTTIDTTGWNGDGELIYQFYLDKEKGQKFEDTVKQAEHWQSLPMTATLDELVYEHFDGVIPRVENGYYFFYDEQRKTHEAAENIVEISSSYDFIIGMYDTESRTVYYYEQHT